MTCVSSRDPIPLGVSPRDVTPCHPVSPRVPPTQLWRQGKGDFFLGCLLMAELSTPFVCLGKVLILVSTQGPRPRPSPNP